MQQNEKCLNNIFGFLVALVWICFICQRTAETVTSRIDVRPFSAYAAMLWLLFEMFSHAAVGGVNLSFVPLLFVRTE